MFKTLLIIGMGGFLGSTSRYLASKLIAEKIDSGFPWGTFSVNIIGCFILGLIYVLAEHHDWLTLEWRWFLAVGFCGSFTTFSTFSYESHALYQSGNIGIMMLYTIISVIVGFGATYLGTIAGKGI